MYEITSAIIFGLLFCVWRRSDWYNLLIKIILLGMTIWGVVKFIH